MRRLLLRLVLVVLVPLLLAQAGIYTAWYYSRLVIEDHATVDSAEMTAVLFDDFVNDVRRQEIAIGEALAGLHPYTSKQAHEYLVRNDLEYPAVHSWNWVAPDGKIIESSNHQAVNRSVADRDYFRKLAEGRRLWVISDLLTDRVSGKLSCVVASRVEENGKTVNVVSAVVNIDKLGRTFWRRIRSRSGC